VWKMFVCVCIFNLVTVIGVWFRTWWSSLVLYSMSELGVGGQSGRYADHLQLCMFTSFKPAAHKLPVWCTKL